MHQTPTIAAENLLKVCRLNSNCQCTHDVSPTAATVSTIQPSPTSDENTESQSSDDDSDSSQESQTLEQRQSFHSEKFKLTGCNLEERYQTALEILRECMLKGRAAKLDPNNVIDVKVEAEPNNPADC